MSGWRPRIRKRQRGRTFGQSPKRPFSSHLDRVCRSNVHRSRDGQKYAGRADLLLFIIQASEHMGMKGDEEEEDRKEQHRNETRTTGEPRVLFLDIFTATDTNAEASNITSQPYLEVGVHSPWQPVTLCATESLKSYLKSPCTHMAWIWCFRRDRVVYGSLEIIGIRLEC